MLSRTFDRILLAFLIVAMLVGMGRLAPTPASPNAVVAYLYVTLSIFLALIIFYCYAKIRNQRFMNKLSTYIFDF